MTRESGLPADQRAWVDVLMAGASEGVVLTDAHGTILRANASAEGILGRSADELRGQTVFEPAWKLAGPEGEPLRAHAPDLPGTGTSTEVFHCTVERGDGERRRLSVKAVPLEVAGTLQGRAFFLEDVTERRAVDAARQAAAVSLLAFLESSPDAMVVHRQGRLIYANPATLAFLGYGGLEEVVGRSILELTHPDDRPAILDRVRRMQQTGSGAVPLVRERFLRADGGVFTADVFALPIFFQGGPAILVVGHDAASRLAHEAERRRFLEEQTALREEAQQRANELKEILAHMVSGLFVANAEGKVVLSNPAAARLLGRGAADELLMDVGALSAALNLRKPDGSPVSRDELPLVRALRGETVDHHDEVITGPEGGPERHLRTSAAPIRNEQREVVGAVALVRDVSDLVEFDRLKDQFIRVAAHELKTPLTILKGYAQLLLRTPLDAPAPRDAVEAIDRGADRINRMVEDMLELSQLLGGTLYLEREPVDLAELVREAAARVEPRLTRHRLHLEIESAEVEVDRRRIGQVMSRLLDNALRYSPGGGDVELRLIREEGWAKLFVKDQGVGIAQAKQGRLAQRFYRAHTDTPHDYGGLGLALSLSHELIASHGGELWFESVEGQGSTFAFRLPLRGGHGR